MKIDIMCYFIKYLGIHISLLYCSLKIIDCKDMIKKYTTIFLLFTAVILSTTNAYMQKTYPIFLTFIPIIIVYSIIICKMFKQEFIDTAVIEIISLAVSYFLCFISIVISSTLYATLNNLPFMNNFKDGYLVSYISFTIGLILNVCFTFFLFKIKRFRNGLSFLNNDYMKFLILFLTIIFIFAYTMCNRVIIVDEKSSHYIILSLAAVSIVSVFIFKTAFILYQKQKNQIATLKSYEQELAETKEKLQTAIDEREKISKAQHELDKRQKALQQEISKLVNSTYNAEMANEFASILDRLNNLTKEYSFKTQALPNLSKTHISEIDNIITYLQNECAKNGIDFIFKLDCNIQKILDNYISCDKLETLIGDLVTNAIIAVNNSENSFKSIMLIIGLKDSFYQIDVYDSGKNFEIDTLLNLGIKKCSTYIGKGGSGYGWITTFETLHCSKASLTITELKDNNYSKFISIIFDNSSKYTINSYRIDEIRKNKSTRKIFLNKT